MKILIVTTISNTINAFLIPHIEYLVKKGYHVEIACNITQELDNRIKELGCEVHNVHFQRSPLKINNYSAYLQIKRLIEYKKYDVVHTHTPVASAIVRIACRKMVKPKIIYTAHGFHFFTGASIANWLFYYPVELWLSKYTDVLITINREDYDRAKKSFGAKSIEYVPGVGIDVSKFKEKNENILEKRRGLGIPKDAFVILSVGELNKNKNHQIVIKAMSLLKDPNVYYIICGEGKLLNFLKKIAQEMGVSEKVNILGFREDVSEIYKVANLFIHPSFREGLPVAVMEAMASGLPIICSNIRGNRDLIDDKKGGYLIEPNDVNGFKNAIETIISDVSIQLKFIEWNNRKVENYDKEIIIEKIGKIYSNL